MTRQAAVLWNLWNLNKIDICHSTPLSTPRNIAIAIESANSLKSAVFLISQKHDAVNHGQCAFTRRAEKSPPSFEVGKPRGSRHADVGCVWRVDGGDGSP